MSERLLRNQYNLLLKQRESLEKKFGGWDIIVNNAIGVPGSQDNKYDPFQRFFETFYDGIINRVKYKRINYQIEKMEELLANL